MIRKLKNPFLLAGYYGKDYFCNREKELAELENHFENERNVLLYSWRKYGKTALIRCFIDNLEKQKKAQALYIDLLGTRTIDDAILNITRAVYNKYGKANGGISAKIVKLISAVGLELSFDANTGIPSISFGIRRTNDMPEKSLEALGDFLQTRKTVVLVALDEFQQIKHYPQQNGEAVFRAWMQQFPAIRFIFSGSHKNMMQLMFAEKSRPFYQSAQLMQLETIQLKHYKQFIKHHFASHNKSISTDAIQEIYCWSRSQTYCIQLVCNRLFGLYDNVETGHLQQVFEDILKEDSAVFSNYTNLLTHTQWHVLLAIAKEEPLQSPTANDFIKKYNLGPPSTISTALNKLLESEIVVKDDDKYLVHEVLLARWLQSL